MAKSTHKIWIVTSDEALIASARAAASSLEGWEFPEPRSVEELLTENLDPADVVLLDAWLKTENVYESSRRLTGRSRCRAYVVTDDRNDFAAPIAMFCGAAGTIERPITTKRLREITSVATTRELPQDKRETDPDRPLPELLLHDLHVGDGARRLIDVLVDPETGLYSFEFLTYKLDEEFKRARRFGQPLSCVMLGFEGQADDSVLTKLAGIFLNASRDTDILGRFDQSSFLFFLPNTGPDGAEIMARRICVQSEEANLRDLVGDRLRVSVGISYYPHPEILQREELFAMARTAFSEAQSSEDSVVRCH